MKHGRVVTFARLAVLLVAALLVLSPVACLSMAPRVYRQELPLRFSGDETPGSPDWTSDLAKKPWTEGDPGWRRKRAGPSTGYTEDQKYMILLRRPKPQTWRHEKDMVSDMIWAREKSRNK